MRDVIIDRICNVFFFTTSVNSETSVAAAANLTYDNLAHCEQHLKQAYAFFREGLSAVNDATRAYIASTDPEERVMLSLNAGAALKDLSLSKDKFQHHLNVIRELGGIPIVIAAGDRILNIYAEKLIPHAEKTAPAQAEIMKRAHDALAGRLDFLQDAYLGSTLQDEVTRMYTLAKEQVRRLADLAADDAADLAYRESRKNFVKPPRAVLPPKPKK